MDKVLTGKTRYCSTWRGKLVLQVQEAWSDECTYGGPRNKGLLWRDARTEDLAELQALAVQVCLVVKEHM